MSSSKAARSKPTEHAAAAVVTRLFSGVPGVVVGEVVEHARDGSIMINYPANQHGPLPARTLVHDVYAGARVLLAFESGLPTLPIVLGVLHEKATAQNGTVHLKADRIVLEANEQLVLRCGEAGLEAGRNGNVHLTGKDVVSRATRTNKVRGATVLIN